jgi:hypothetical protein
MPEGRRLPEPRSAERVLALALLAALCAAASASVAARGFALMPRPAAWLEVREPPGADPFDQLDGLFFDFGRDPSASTAGSGGF